MSYHAFHHSHSGSASCRPFFPGHGSVDQAPPTLTQVKTPPLSLPLLGTSA